MNTRQDGQTRRPGARAGLLATVAVLIAPLVATLVAPLQAESPPTIQIVEALSARLLHTDVEWFDPVDGLIQIEGEAPPCTTDLNGRCTKSNPYQQAGVWNETTSASGPSVSATAWQHSTVGDHSIHGFSKAEVDSVQGKSPEASSELQIAFSVPQGSDFQLRVYFHFAGSFAVNGTAVGHVWVAGANPDFGGVYTAHPEDPDSWVLEYDGDASTGSLTLLIIAAAAQPGTEAAATSMVEVSYAMHFGVVFSDGFETGDFSAW